MNKEKKSKELAEMLKDIVTHPMVDKEINQYIFGSGHEKEFFNLLTKQLYILKQEGYKAIELASFEKLLDVKDLYSMHIRNKHFNIRILYSYFGNGEILLHCFYEKQGKSITEYRTHIPVALKRKKEMEELL